MNTLRKILPLASALCCAILLVLLLVDLLGPKLNLFNSAVTKLFVLITGFLAAFTGVALIARRRAAQRRRR